MAEHQEDIMGQYQQWLHYREMGQQLRMQIETLEAELAELQTRARSLEEENDSCVDADTGENELFRLLSLAIHLDAHASSTVSEPAPTNGMASSSPIITNEVKGVGEAGAGESFSPTFFTWGRPAEFGPQEVPAAARQPGADPEWPSSPPPSPLPQPGIELLPEDMAAFFDEHGQTDPQLVLPWWQQQEVASANTHGSGLIDQQGLRNKHEIERWLERWRRQPAQPTQPENQGETPHG